MLKSGKPAALVLYGLYTDFIPVPPGQEKNPFVPLNE